MANMTNLVEKATLATMQVLQADADINAAKLITNQGEFHYFYDVQYDEHSWRMDVHLTN